MADLLISMGRNPIYTVKPGIWHTEFLNISKNDSITILLDLYKYDSYCFIIKTIVIGTEMLPSNISVVRVCKNSSKKLTEFKIYANTFDRDTIKSLLVDCMPHILKKVEVKFWKSNYSEIKFGSCKLYTPTGRDNLIEVSV